MQNLVPHIILLCALANLRQGGDIKTPLSNSAQQLQNKALRRVNLKLLWWVWTRKSQIFITYVENDNLKIRKIEVKQR